MADSETVAEISIGGALAREAARNVAVQCENRALIWESLHRRTNRIARALENRGLKQGDFLTIALPNGVEFAEACYTAWKVGAIPQPVSFGLRNSMRLLNRMTKAS